MTVILHFLSIFLSGMTFFFAGAVGSINALCKFTFVLQGKYGKSQRSLKNFRNYYNGGKGTNILLFLVKMETGRKYFSILWLPSWSRKNVQLRNLIQTAAALKFPPFIPKKRSKSSFFLHLIWNRRPTSTLQWHCIAKWSSSRSSSSEGKKDLPLGITLPVNLTNDLWRFLKGRNFDRRNSFSTHHQKFIFNGDFLFSIQTVKSCYFYFIFSGVKIFNYPRTQDASAGAWWSICGPKKRSLIFRLRVLCLVCESNKEKSENLGTIKRFGQLWTKSFFNLIKL